MKRLVSSFVFFIAFSTALCAQPSTTATGYYHYHFWLADGTKKYFVSDVMEYEKVNPKHYMETLRILYPEVIAAKSSGSFNSFIPQARTKADLWPMTTAQRLQTIESARKKGYQIIEIGILKPTIKPHNPSTAKPF
jgi:hypothetical protein